jgi:hypothetical protein
MTMMKILFTLIMISSGSFRYDNTLTQPPYDLIQPFGSEPLSNYPFLTNIRFDAYPFTNDTLYTSDSLYSQRPNLLKDRWTPYVPNLFLTNTFSAHYISFSAMISNVVCRLLTLFDADNPEHPLLTSSMSSTLLSQPITTETMDVDELPNPAPLIAVAQLILWTPKPSFLILTILIPNLVRLPLISLLRYPLELSKI